MPLLILLYALITFKANFNAWVQNDQMLQYLVPGAGQRL